MKTTKFYLFGLLFFFLFLAVSRVWAVNQAFFSLSPPDSSPQVGKTFNIDISLNTDSAKVSGADAVLTFDPAKLSVVTLTPGAIFDSYPKKTFDESGNINLSGLMAETTASFSGIGKFGTITFKALTSGSTTLSFSCASGETADTNIIQMLTGSDIVDCSQTSPSSISIGSAVGAPTAAPTAIPSPPPAGSLGETFSLTAFGFGLLILGYLSWWLVRRNNGPA